MGKDFALYVGYNCQRQHRLACELSVLGMELHKEASIEAATERLHEQVYSLSLIQFEDVPKQVFDFFTLLRSKNPNSIVIVLVDKPQNKTEKHLFDSGIDDVVTGNSTDTSILVSRIKRRLFSGRLCWSQANKIMLKGGASVDLCRREVYRNGVIHHLSNSANKLLRYFLKNPGRIVTKDELWESDIWERSVSRACKEEEGRAFDMAMGRLRKIIEANVKNPQIIKTVHGGGWILAKDAVL